MILRRQLPAWSPITARALAAGLLPSSAEVLRGLERRIASEYQPSRVLLTRSGTVALAMSFLASAPEGQRPRIVLPAWGCFDLMTAADAVNAEVFLYDLDPSTLAPDGESFHRALEGSSAAGLRSSPHAVVIAHWFGIPVEMGPLVREARASGVLVIDDAAQAVGASIGGNPVGTAGDFGVLSFGRGKGRTGGEGGALLAYGGKAAEAISRVSGRLGNPASALGSYAALWGQWILGRPALYGVPASLPGLHLGETVYHRPPELRSMSKRSAAVLEAVWPLSLAEVAARRSNAARWQEVIDRAPAIGLAPMVPPPGAEPGWLRFPLLAPPDGSDRLSGSAARSRGIMRGYPVSLSELPTVPGRIVSRSQYEGAAVVSQHLFTLPTHSKVTEADFEVIATLFR